MADFSVNTAGLDMVSDELAAISRRLQQIGNEAKSVINQTRSVISTRLPLSSKSYVIHSSVSNCSADFSALFNALNKVARIYNSSEKSVSSKDVSSSFDDSRALARELVEAAAAVATVAGGTAPYNNWFDKYVKALDYSSWPSKIFNAITEDSHGLAKIPKINKLLENIKGANTIFPVASLYLSIPALSNNVLKLYKEYKNGGNIWNEILETGSATIDFGSSVAGVVNVGKAVKGGKVTPWGVYLSIATSGIDSVAKGADTYDKLNDDGKVDMKDWGEIGVRSSVKGLTALFTFGMADDEKISDWIIQKSEDAGTAIGNFILKLKSK